MSKYRDLIPQNIAPKEVKRIGIYNSDNMRVGAIQLGNLVFPNVGQKLYSFGALSDVHIGYDTSVPDFQKALSYLKDMNFICVCGDLTGQGSDEQLTQYKSIVDTYSPNTPVYAIAGNHESYTTTDIENQIAKYTGHPLYYSFTFNNDVFIMVGTIGGEMYSNGVVFAKGTLQWLQETLEANRNKRCFVFFHIFQGVTNEATCGNANGLYTNWCWHDNAECQTFENLMKHYKNVILFHGHSHLRYSMQRYGTSYANYSESEGYRSVHIPSLAVPRREDTDGDGTLDVIYAGSEGCIVDVYENGIHLRGRDFAKDVFLPIASYWIDTTLHTIEKGSYTDPTGTLVVSEAN